MDNLSSLKSEAAQIDAEAHDTPASIVSAPGVTEQPAAPVDYADEAHSLLTFAVSMLGPLYPSLNRIYTPETVDKLAAKAGPVMEKYGLTAGGLFEKWKKEIDLAVIAVPLAIATYKGIRADLAAMKERAQQDEQPPAGTLEA